MRAFFLFGLVMIFTIGLFGGCSSDSSSGGGDTEELPDLLFYSINAGSMGSVESGQPVAIRYTIENAASGGSGEEADRPILVPSAGPDAGAFDVEFYFTTNQTFDPATARLMLPVLEISGLDAGSWTMGDYWVLDVPADMTPGQYYVFGVIDSDDEVDEDDETNNLGMVGSDWQIDVLTPDGRLPDIGINFGSYGSVLVQGSETTITMGFTNWGSTASLTTCVAYLYLSDNTVFDPGDESIPVSPIIIPELATGEQQRIEIAFTVPSSRLGAQFILIVSDTEGVITESNENNNVEACGVTINE
ncbi:MAG: hypothetical protein KOO63_15655 [Bacteroidales bacterium]|nr:hypothetical protein [Candidatus Latescibacterota bacterium]